MKPANVPLLKELRTNKTIQRKIGTSVLKSRFKDQSTKRQRIILSVDAGHVSRRTFVPLNSNAK
jgi:hypothetical protein